MLNKLKQNLVLKIFSICAAIVVWIVVMNIERPVIDKSYQMVVTIKNDRILEKQNKSYVVLDSKDCEIQYNVRAEDNSRIRQSDFNVYVDMNELKNNEYLPIHCDILNDMKDYVHNVKLSKDALHIKLIDIAKFEKEVEYNIVGDLVEMTNIGAVILNPPIVNVTGNNDVIEKIEKIKIDIPIGAVSETISGTAKVHLVDANGDTINTKDVTLSDQEINYTVIMVKAKKLNIHANTEGTVKEGYKIDTIVVHPEAINVIGPTNAVDMMENLELPAVNVENFDSNFDCSFTLVDLLPLGIASDTTGYVTVNIKIVEDPEYDNKKVDVGSNIIGPHLQTIEYHVEEINSEE